MLSDWKFPVCSEICKSLDNLKPELLIVYWQHQRFYDHNKENSDFITVIQSHQT